MAPGWVAGSLLENAGSPEAVSLLDQPLTASSPGVSYAPPGSSPTVVLDLGLILAVIVTIGNNPSYP